MIDTGRLFPVVIGCSGGSGSRMLRDILAACPQIHMDQDCTPNSKDSRGSNAFIQRDNRTRPDIHDLIAAFMQSVRDQIAPHRMDQYRCFGWKNPANLKVVDLLMASHPRLHFIHLVRNPADLVHGRLARKGYKRQRAKGHPDAARGRLWFVLSRWARLNPAVWQRYRDEPRYRLVRYEDVLQRPRETIEDLLGWLGVDRNHWRLAADSIDPPADAMTRGEQVDLSPIAAAAATFGYCARTPVPSEE